jgi:hypothetical protein
MNIFEKLTSPYSSAIYSGSSNQDQSNQVKTQAQTYTYTPSYSFSEKQKSELETANARLLSGTASDIDTKNIEYAKSKGWSPSTTTQPKTTIADTTLKTDTGTVNSLYQKYFGRDATQAELNNWQKESSSTLDTFLKSEQVKYGVTDKKEAAPVEAATAPKKTISTPEAIKLDTTASDASMKEAEARLERSEELAKAYEAKAKDIGTLTEEDKAAIAKTGETAGVEYDPLIEAKKQEKIQQQARDLVSYGQIGGFMSSQIAGVGAFAQTVGGTFVGAGGILSRLQDTYSTAVATLEAAQVKAVQEAETAKEAAIKSGKREDLEAMYTAYEMANTAYSQQQELTAMKQAKEEKLYEYQRYEREDAQKTISAMAEAGYSPDQLDDDYAAALDKSAGMPEGYSKQLLDVSYKAKKAETDQQKLEAASSLASLLANTKTGGTVEVNGTKYTIMGTDEKGIQTTFETAKNGDVYAVKYDPSTGTATSEKIGLNLGADTQIVNYKVNGTDAPFAVITDENGKTTLKPLFSSNDSSALVNSTISSLCPTGTTGTPYRSPSDPYYDQCGAGVNDMYDESIGKIWGNTQEEKAATLEQYGTIDPNTAKINDTVVIDAGNSDHVAIINSVYNDPQTGEKMYRLSEQNWKKDTNGNGIWTHDRVIPATDASIVGVTRIPLRPELQSGTDTGRGINIGGVTLSDDEPLSPSELKSYQDLGYRVEAGMTLSEVIASGKIPDIQMEIPTFNEYVKNVSEAKGMYIDPATLQAGYEATVGAIPSYVDAATNLSYKFAGDKKPTKFINDIQTALQDGDFLRAQDKLKKAAIDTADATTATQVRGRDDAANALEIIKSDLDALNEKGTYTNLFTGTEEQIAEKIGKTVDPDVRALATKISAALSTYRRAMTGVAFSPSESVMYEKMFPSILSETSLNTANIDALISTFQESNKTFFMQQFGSENYNAIFGY